MLIPLSDENDDRSFPLVNILILLACVTLFTIQCLLPEKAQGAWVNTLAFDTKKFFGGGYPSLEYHAKLWTSLKILFTPSGALVPAISSAFMHANIAHLLGNMLFLWVFGDNVEHAMGRVRYIVFFLLTAVLALWVQVVLGGAGKYVYLGASGAISAVMGAYLFYYPKAVINLYLFSPDMGDTETDLLLLDPDRDDDDPHLRWTARTYLIFCFATQVSIGLATWGKDYLHVAVWAHVGGYVFGFLLARIFKDPSVIFKREGDRMFGSEAGQPAGGEYREYIFGTRFNPAKKTVHKRPSLSEMRKKGDAEAKRRKRLGSDWMKPGKE